MNTVPTLDFEALYAECGEGLYRFCFRLLGNRAEAEDLVQDVFVAAIHGKDRFAGKSSVRTWLYRIALYQAGKRRARRHREVPLHESTPAQAPVERVDIDQAIDHLPSKLRQAFILVKVEEFTSLEAAEILGLPEGTVKFHVYEAIRQLRATLEVSPLPTALGKESPHAV